MGTGLERRTRQREIILEELRKVRSHPTADELYELVRKRLPRLSLATVYRNLELMAQDGLVRRILSGRQRRYDGDAAEHAHVVCVSCGKVGDLGAMPPDDTPLPSCDGFAVTERRVEYRGVCRQCGGKGKETRSQEPGVRRGNKSSAKGAVRSAREN